MRTPLTLRMGHMTYFIFTFIRMLTIFDGCLVPSFVCESIVWLQILLKVTVFVTCCEQFPKHLSVFKEF